MAHPLLVLADFENLDSAEITRWPTTLGEARAWAGALLDDFPNPEEILAWQRGGDAGGYVLRQAGSPVAYGELWIDRTVNEAELAKIIVKPSLRRRGIGSRFVRLLLERAGALGLPVAYVRVVPDNVEAIRCYEHAGFVRVSPNEQRDFNENQPRPYVWLKRSLSEFVR